MQKIAQKEKKEFTKEEIKAVARLWKESSTSDIAKELKITVAQVVYLATQIRKAGFKLPKKRRNGVNQFLVKEAMGELVDDKEWDEENGFAI